jgi:predicted DCC family thiol-disulfide oxidoreductase YuxK
MKERATNETNRQKSMKTIQEPVVLFDGSCNFCTTCVELLHVLDWRHRLQCLPFQAPGVPQSYGLTVAQCEQAVWAISPGGYSYRGAQAVNAVLDSIVVLPFFLFLYRLPGLGQIEDKVYAWIAKNRRFLTGIRPYCECPVLPCGM